MAALHCCSLDPTMNVACDQSDPFHSAMWFMQGLCAEYKTGFDSLKQMMPLCESRLTWDEMQQFQYEIACVEDNLAQLDSYYKTLQQSLYLESTSDSMPEPTDLLAVDDCFDLNQANHNYFPLESTSNFGLEQVTFDCSADVVHSEKLTLSSMDYLLSIDDSDDFLEFIKSEEQLDLCKLENESSIRKPEFESASFNVDKRKHSTKANKSNKCKAANGKATKANAAAKKSRPNEARIWYKCAWEGCSFGSYYNGVVKRHSLKRHSGRIRIDKSSNSSMHRFKCDWPGCEVSLVAYHKLVEHKRKHTGEKPFRCKWKSCNYATARLYSMIIHERTHKLDPFAD